MLPRVLDEYHVDFVNLGMFQLKNSDGTLVDGLPPGVPDHYSTYDLACHRDNIKILYDSAKWQLMEVKGVNLASNVDRDLNYVENTEDMYGCFNVNADGKGDRVYGIFPFKMKTGPLTMIVVFSHFPHPPSGLSSSDTSVPVSEHKTLKDILGTKINVLKDASGVAKVLVIADLNLDMPHAEKAVKFAQKKAEAPVIFGLEPSMSSEEVWETMAIDGSPKLGAATEYKLTCCSDKNKKMGDGVTLYEPAHHSKFTFAFDRVLANFGTMETVMPLEEWCPTEACSMYVGAFHKPIIGEITVADE